MKKENYPALDGLRVVSMIGILIMHVLNNVPYCHDLPTTYWITVKFGELTSLFMMISAFSISCGYFERIKNGGFTEVVNFYKKRYIKVFPFFALLTLLDLLMNFSFGTLAESFANLTLVFGFIPHENITVIGVGWTLGVIFVFYILYPFFAFMMSNKKIFNISFACSILYTFVFNEYFNIGKVDFIYCAVYFFAGCALYLYRNDLVKVYNRTVVLILIIMATVVYYKTSLYEVKFILLSLILFYAIGLKNSKTLLSNKIMKWLSGISFEIYLSHMVVFRIIEKLGLLSISSNYFISFCTATSLVFFGTLLISKGFQLLLTYISKKRALP